jgi:pimeloyl-ACP methyl ester carboxylesterase
MPTVRRAGLDIHYTAWGEGRPIVLGHSFLCSGEMWAPQVEPLAAAGYRVINVDARGHGKSGRIDSDFTLYDMVDDVLAVLDDLGIERAIWAGLSIGGMVALRAALVVPQRVEALILLDTDAGPESAWKRFKYSVLGTIARTAGLGPVLPLVMPLMFGSTTRRLRPDLVAEWRERFSRVHVPSILRMLRALQDRDDVVPRLPEIAVPALVVVGEEDVSLPPVHSRVLARGLSGSRLVEVPGAGHLSALERPEAVTAAMLEFLRSV